MEAVVPQANQSIAASQGVRDGRGLTLAIMDCLALLLVAFSHLQSWRLSICSMFAMSPVSSRLLSLLAILRAFAARFFRAVLLCPASSFGFPKRSASLR